MTQTALVLSLNTAQVEQLAGYCAAYRTHAWHEIAPTAERNQTLRAVQAVQGRLTTWKSEQRTEPLLFALTEEERQALRQMIGVLLQIPGVQISPEGRAQALNGLASWLQKLRVVRQTQVLGSQRGGPSYG